MSKDSRFFYNILAPKDKQTYLKMYDSEREEYYDCFDASFELRYPAYIGHTENIRVGVSEHRYHTSGLVTYSFYSLLILDGETFYNVLDFTFEGAERSCLCTVTEDLILVLNAYDKNGCHRTRDYWYIDLVFQRLITRRRGNLYKTLSRISGYETHEVYASAIHSMVSTVVLRDLGRGRYQGFPPLLRQSC